MSGSCPSTRVRMPGHCARWRKVRRNSSSSGRTGGRVTGSDAGLTILPSDPNAVNCGVEIGMTAYAPHAAGTAINPAAKRLLLAHAFGEGALRIQFQIDTRNKRSQAAVLKLGAKQEGVLRNHRVLQDGFVRDTAFFSILDSEWPDVKARLDARLAAFG